MEYHNSETVLLPIKIVHKAPREPRYLVGFGCRICVNLHIDDALFS
jgi:hypothetical protein